MCNCCAVTYPLPTSYFVWLPSTFDNNRASVTRHYRHLSKCIQCLVQYDNGPIEDIIMYNLTKHKMYSVKELHKCLLRYSVAGFQIQVVGFHTTPTPNLTVATSVLWPLIPPPLPIR